MGIEDIITSELDEADTAERALAERQYAGNLHGVARPAGFLRAAFRELHGLDSEEVKTIPLRQALDEALAIEEMATRIQGAMEKGKQTDGSTDYRVAAAYMLRQAKGE